MNRIEQHDDQIDLGTASSETLGIGSVGPDEQGQALAPGLSDD